MANVPRESKDKDDIDSESWINSIYEKHLSGLEGVNVQAYRSISIVPDQLKKSKEGAYQPKVVSIGPLYKGTRRHLQYMDDIKWRSMLSLLCRTGDSIESIKKCGKVILDLDDIVRACYLDDIKLDRHQLARIMLHDGCFLLELLIARSNYNEKLPSRLPPGPEAKVGKMEEVLSDLTLLENQIPVFILHALSRILFPDDFTDNNAINKLALSVLGYSPAGCLNSCLGAAHFVDLVHRSIPEEMESERVEESHHLSIPVDREEVNSSHGQLNRCATRLHAAGVTIKPPDELAGNSNQVRSQFRSQWDSFVRKLRRLVSMPYQHQHQHQRLSPDITSLKVNVRFSDGKLEIPPLHITKTTEARWRNFIAWEHRTTAATSKFTSYALLFNYLICGVEDVQRLKDRKVIVDHLNMTNGDLLTFLRTITTGVEDHFIDSGYVQMVDELNKYSGTNCATEFFITAGHYFKPMFKFLRRNYNFAAAMVLLLTGLQTFYTVYSYYHQK